MAIEIPLSVPLRCALWGYRVTFTSIWVAIESAASCLGSPHPFNWEVGEGGVMLLLVGIYHVLLKRRRWGSRITVEPNWLGWYYVACLPLIDPFNLAASLSIWKAATAIDDVLFSNWLNIFARRCRQPSQVWIKKKVSLCPKLSSQTCFALEQRAFVRPRRNLCWNVDTSQMTRPLKTLSSISAFLSFFPSFFLLFLSLLIGLYFAEAFDPLGVFILCSTPTILYLSAFKGFNVTSGLCIQFSLPEKKG